MKTLSFEMFQLALLQTYLIEQGVFIRGCINIGHLYAREGIFFGEAFNEAYKYEKEVAVNPLIVLSQNVVNSIRAYSPYQSDDILSLYGSHEMKFNHSHYYINYLHMMETMSLYREPKQISTFIELHKKFIMEELEKNAEDVKVFMKYLWLKEFHDHYVPRMAEITGRNDLLIQ